MSTKATKKLLIIVTQPPYGKEEAAGAIPLASTQQALDNEAIIVFVSGGVHSIVSGQVSGYGPITLWQKDIPTIESAIEASADSIKYFALDSDLKTRGIEDAEIINGVSKISIGELTNLVLSCDNTFVM